MMIPKHRQTPRIERLQDLFDTDVTRLVLSTLIILSVTPQLEHYALLFFSLFFIELSVRVLILWEKLRRRELDRLEPALLLFDLVATLSFLPLEPLLDVRLLRLARLSRMLLLLSYWKPVVREIWIILSKRERRYQLTFVASVVMLLTFTTALLIYHLHGFAIDFDDNGSVDTHPRFWIVCWWCFRQLQDPGNLLHQTSSVLALGVSLALTMAGIFIVTFLIGIGTTVVEELVTVSRERPLGLRNHSIIANLGPHSRVLVDELVTYYTKSLRSPRLVTMGPAPTRFDFMYQERLRSVRYRQGSPNVTHDLRKIDTSRARRVILLGRPDHPESDAEVVSQALSVREINPHALIYTELFDAENVYAALAADGATVPVLSRRFVALVLGQILTHPGSEDVFAELLSSEGQEIYTSVYGMGALEHHVACPDRLPAFRTLMEHAHRQHGVVLLGSLQRRTDDRRILMPRLGMLPPDTAHTTSASPNTVAGWFGLARNFEQLKRAVVDLNSNLHQRTTDPAPKWGAVPALYPEAKEPPLHKALIAGFHDGLIDICERVITLGDRVQLYVLVPGQEQLTLLRSLLLARNTERELHAGDDHHSHSAIHYVEGSDDQLSYTVTGNVEKRGIVQLMVGSAADERMLLAHPRVGFALEQMDAVVLTYTQDDPDPDARTALGLLKLLRLGRDQPALLAPHLRILCAMRDEAKANLFARRFARRNTATDGEQPSVAIVSLERVRNAFLAQAVFVPGIAEIYDELLGHGPHRLQRIPFAPATNTGHELDYGAILLALYQRDGLVTLALELGQGETRRTIVAPTPQSDDYRFPAQTLRAAYVIANHSGEPPQV